MFCVCLTIPQTSYQSQDAKNGDITSFLRKKLHQATEWNSDTTNIWNLFVLLNLQRSRIQDEFQQHKNWQSKEVAETIESNESSICGQEFTRGSREADENAMCAHWPRSKKLRYREWQRRQLKRSWRGFSQKWWDLWEYSHSQDPGTALFLQTRPNI